MRTKILTAVLIGLLVTTGLALTVRARDDDRSGSNSGRRDGDVMLKKLEDKAMKFKEKFEVEDEDLPDVEKGNQPNPSLFIGPNGKGIISGMVVSAPSGSPSTMGVEVWRLRLNVDVSEARIIPEQNTGTTTSTTTAMAVGNKVSVKGQMNPDTGVVKASVVHDLSVRAEKVSRIQKRIEELLRKLNELRERLGQRPISL